MVVWAVREVDEAAGRVGQGLGREACWVVPLVSYGATAKITGFETTCGEIIPKRKSFSQQHNKEMSKSGAASHVIN